MDPPRAPDLDISNLREQPENPSDLERTTGFEPATPPRQGSSAGSSDLRCCPDLVDLVSLLILAGVPERPGVLAGPDGARARGIHHAVERHGLGRDQPSHRCRVSRSPGDSAATGRTTGESPTSLDRPPQSGLPQLGALGRGLLLSAARSSDGVGCPTESSSDHLSSELARWGRYLCRREGIERKDAGERSHARGRRSHPRKGQIFGDGVP